MKIQMLKTQNGIEDQLQAMVERANTTEAFLNKVIYRQYQKAQIQRWETENQSQGDQWSPLTLQYAKYKKKKFASYPGAGNALMIATGKLSNSAIGRDTAGITKLVSSTGIRIALNLSYIPYAGYAAERRPVMEFSEATVRGWHQALVKFISTGFMEAA